MFLKSIYEPYPCTLVDRSPLIQMLAVFTDFSPQTVIWNLFYIDLYLLSRNQELRIPAVMLTGRLLLSLSPAQPHPPGCVKKSTVAAGITQLLGCHIGTFPAISKVCLIHTLADQGLFLLCMLFGMAVGSVRAFFQ